MPWTRKDLVSMQDIEPAEITDMLDTAESMKEIATREIKKVPALRGKTVVNLFYEASTRTRTSFEIAGKWLSADVINFSASGSSAEKGESFLDTAKNIEAMSPDVVVVRHKASGGPALLARHLKCSVVNAGDGAHEHPTQALLDLLTIRERKGHLEGLNVAIVGDITPPLEEVQGTERIARALHKENWSPDLAQNFIAQLCRIAAAAKWVAETNQLRENF